MSSQLFFVSQHRSDREMHEYAAQQQIIVMQFYVQNLDSIALVLTCVGTVCWAICFWWMHRISSRQDALLKELREMTSRVEKLSQSEHDLISEVHPRVNEIKEHVENVREAVSPEN